MTSRTANETIPSFHAGGGRIALSLYGSHAVFSELSSTYPLKLMSPRISKNGVAIVYILSYGGGLVGGDQVSLSVDVGTGTVLLVLSQGSTKVFKTRPAQRLASVRTERQMVADSSIPEASLVTMQDMTYVVAAGGALFLLPDPVTCFRSASYRQTQTFHLSGTSSLVVLDWLTSGRKTLGENWSFSRYHSVNEIWTNGKRIVNDVMLLSDEEEANSKLPQRTLCDSLAPYSCYAMVILCGPLVQGVIHDMAARYHQISVYKTKAPAEMIWSLSPINCGTGNGDGAVVRVAGLETEIVKTWLEKSLSGLQEAAGADIYRRAFV